MHAMEERKQGRKVRVGVMLALQGWEVKKNFRNMTGGSQCVPHRLLSDRHSDSVGLCLKTGPLGTE